MRTLLIAAVLLAAATSADASGARADAEGPPAPAPQAPQADSTALQLFTSVESAWSVRDSDRLASLVDTATVRIGLKPGAPPASAMTRNAAAFLFQDQLHLVDTRSFRVVKVEVSAKGTARAVARWSGDWGGRQGLRDVEVVLVAAQSGKRWRLTEVRAND